MSNHIFSSKFVSAVRSILSAGCADGKRLTREEICEALEYEGFSVSPSVIGLAISDGTFNTAKQAWDLFKGRFGGVRELDIEATAKAEAAFQARAEKIRARVEKAMATKAAKKQAQLETVSTQPTV